MVAFLSEKLSMANSENAEGNGKKRTRRKTTGLTAFCSTQKYSKIMLVFKLLLQLSHKQQSERMSSDFFDLQLLFWKLHLCLLSSFRLFPTFSFKHKQRVLSFSVSTSLRVVTHCAATSNTIILQALEFNQYFLTVWCIT